MVALSLGGDVEWRIFLGIEVDPDRIERRVRTGYIDRMAQTLDEALDICEDARERARGLDWLIGNCAELLPDLSRR